MPSSTLRMMMNDAGMLSLSEVSKAYDVSEPMANSHLQRLKWCLVQRIRALWLFFDYSVRRLPYILATPACAWAVFWSKLNDEE